MFECNFCNKQFGTIYMLTAHETNWHDDYSPVAD